MNKTIGLPLLLFTFALLPLQGRDKQAHGVHIVLDLKSTDASVIARQQAYLQKYQSEYARQLAAVKEECPLVYAHLQLLRLADVNLLSDPGVRRTLVQTLGQPAFATPYSYAQTLSTSDVSPLLVRSQRAVVAMRKCGSPSHLVRVRVNLEGGLTEERGIEDALKMWADCVRGR